MRNISGTVIFNGKKFNYDVDDKGAIWVEAPIGKSCKYDETNTRNVNTIEDVEELVKSTIEDLKLYQK